MRVLGIDPGTAITGYGVVEFRRKVTPVDWGAIRTPAGQADAVRLVTIYRAVRQLIVAHQPDCLAIERLFFNRNTTTALAVGQSRGVVLLAAAEAGVALAEYTPLQVKQAVTGQGNATKMQVGFMVKALLNLAEIPRPDDVADALAIAICCAHTTGSAQKWGGMAE